MVKMKWITNKKDIIIFLKSIVNTKWIVEKGKTERISKLIELAEKNEININKLRSSYHYWKKAESLRKGLRMSVE